MALQGSPRSFLGIDVSSSSIRIAELISRGRRHELSTYGIANRPAKSDLAAQLSELLDQAAVSADAAIFSLPNQQVFATTIKLPDLPDDKVDAAVRFQAQHLIPTKLSDTHLLWSKLNSDITDRRYFLIATPRSVISGLQTLATQLNLNLIGLEPEAFSLLRISPIGGPGTQLICNIGQSEIAAHVVERAGLIASIMHPVPDPPITVKHLAASLTPIYQQFNIRRTTFTGHATLAGDLLSQWAELTGRQSRLINPWRGLSYPPSWEPDLPALSAQLSVAIGLAHQPVTVQV